MYSDFHWKPILVLPNRKSLNFHCAELRTVILALKILRAWGSWSAKRRRCSTYAKLLHAKLRNISYDQTSIFLQVENCLWLQVHQQQEIFVTFFLQFSATSSRISSIIRGVKRVSERIFFTEKNGYHFCHLEMWRPPPTFVTLRNSIWSVKRPKVYHEKGERVKIVIDVTGYLLDRVQKFNAFRVMI